DERAGAYAGTGTFFLFSDTFVGDVAADGSRQNATLVNNSAAFRPAGTPWAQPLQMFVNTDPQSGDPISLFTPAVPGTQPGDFYWLKDAVRLNGTTYVFASWWSAAYARRGIVLITLPPGDLPPFPNHTQQIVPLYLPQLGDATGIVFGGAILPNTAVSGAPQPDGYVYVYGTSDSAAGNGLNKRVYVARVPEADFASAAAWRFWNGSGWVASIQQAAPIADEASVELSVVALPDGRFLLVFQHLQASRRIAIRVGTSPTGPFGPPITIYTCPEPDLRSGIFCYNAKAHPHLSNPGELLISYNVNTTNFADNLRFSDIYRPRFIRLIAP
ncbi:MAG: DUF4185 domain-containing protein, partial [Anaerolineales bacterium]|nr:DUF4185 domain-containing protein [Anaerolineales bacterium]